MARSFKAQLIFLLFCFACTAGAVAVVVMQFSKIDRSNAWLLVVCLLGILFLLGYKIVDSLRLYFNKISFLLEAVENKDYTFHFSENVGSEKERSTHYILNRIKNILYQTQQEAILQEQYYELILNKSQTGFMVYNEKGFITQHNKAVQDLLGITVLTHLAQLERIDPNLVLFLDTLNRGESSPFSIVSQDGSRTLSFRKNSFVRKSETFQMISINDISSELEEKELESWIRLTRVLTHEIMNSMAPIRSLSELLLSNEQLAETERRNSMQVIQTTSNNLISFVEHYRRFSRVPMPEKDPVEVEELLMQCRRLMIQEVSASTKIYVDVDPHIPLLNIDKGQMMQVLINLVRNASEAIVLPTQGRIRLFASYHLSGRWIIGVANNGIPIDKEMQEQLFVPFFTTKEGGSGIGLSLSKQIVRNHQGSLQMVYSTEKETLFTLCFKQ